jgi:nucleolar protein 58
MVATKTALSVRVDALTDADEKSTPSAPTIGLENRAKLEARLRSLEAESDATGVRRFATGPNQQKRIKLGSAAPTYNPAADAVGLVSTQREPMEEAVKAVLDVKEEKRRAKEERRAKRRAEKEKVAVAQKEEEKPDAAAIDGDADAMEVDGEEKVDEKKRKRRKSEVTSSAAVDDGAVTAMVRGSLFFVVVKHGNADYSSLGGC